MELWKKIKGFERYSVSTLGRVRNDETGTIRKFATNKFGYCSISFKHSKNKVKTFTIHRLVANAFIANPFNLPQVNHIDANKQNNNLQNLEWVSAKNNTEHAIKLGLHNTRADNNGRSKLKQNEVDDIKLLLADNIPVKKIAEQFNVCKSTIFKIRQKRIWN